MLLGENDTSVYKMAFDCIAATWVLRRAGAAWVTCYRCARDAGERAMNPSLTSIEQIKSTVIDLAIRFGPRVLVAILILFVGLAASRWVSRWFEVALRKIELEPPRRQTW